MRQEHYNITRNSNITRNGKNEIQKYIFFSILIL